MSKISVLKESLSTRANNINLLQNNFEINTLVEDLITEITNTEYASIWIYSFPILSRERDGITTNISIEDKKGLLYECFSKKEPIIYNSISSEKGYIPAIDNPDNINIKSKIVIPLIENDNFIGIATAYSSVKRVKRFTSDDLEIFDAISPFIIEAIFKMQKNSNKTPCIEHTTTLKHTDENLDKLEKSFADTKAPNEMIEYMSNIVHDIRTPANGLVGFLEILQEQIEDTRLKEYVEHARKSALLINDLTTSILDGVAQKREPSNKEPTIVNTVKFFSNIAEIFSANMSKKSINYNIFIDPLLPKEIEINSMKIKRVIMNLISNASKFTPENGSIEFSLRYKQKEKKLHIFVRDSGIGIAEDKQEKIFEAFAQAESTTKELYGGTGLGLSICASYVKSLGGKLSIESKLNQGSTFYFDIPMDIKDYAHQFEAIKNESTKVAILMDKNNSIVGNNIARYLVKIGVNVDMISAISQINQIQDDITHLICFENKFSIALLMYIKKCNIKILLVEENFLSLNLNNLDGTMLISQYTYFGDSVYSFINEKNIPKILIVEDDKISIILIKSMLENEYCEIDVASDGEEGLTFLRNGLHTANPYNIVYTDHNMPLLSGGEMLKKYKKEEEKYNFKKTITVSVSGDERKLKEYDYDYYATKPFRKKEITSLFLKSID